MTNRFVVQSVLFFLAIGAMALTPPVSSTCFLRVIPYGIYMVLLALVLFLEVKSPFVRRWMNGKFMKAVSKQGEENGN
jgi:uncharacterized membrane protein YcaP (DUF421 family)